MSSRTSLTTSAALAVGLTVLHLGSAANARDQRTPWTKAGSLCAAEARRPAAPIARAIAAKAIDEYYAFGGHEVDASGRMTSFGLVETEQEESSNADQKARLGDLGWWHVLKYWRHLTPTPEANAARGDESNLYGRLGLWAYENASRINDPDAVASAILPPKQMSTRLLGAIARMEKVAPRELAALLAKSTDGPALDAPRIVEVLRELAFRSAIADTPWSAAFIGYVVKAAKAATPGQHERSFAASGSHVTYIYEAFRNALADGAGPDLAPQPLYRACPTKSAPLRVGDMVCYHRQKEVAGNHGATSQDVREAVLKDIEEGRPINQWRLSSTHCDVVVGFARNRRTAFVIGGNVYQSVTVRQLRLDRAGGALLERQPCNRARPGASFDAKPSDGVVRSPVLDNRKCTLNSVPWFVVLQQRG